MLESDPQVYHGKIDRRFHHQHCAKQLKDGVAKLLHTRSVVLFSDIHRGEGGYTEFDRAWRAWPELDADRAKADKLLAEEGWRNGGAVVAAYMRRKPLFPGYGADEGIEGMLVEHVCAVAPSFVTCTLSNCMKCGRFNSQFTAMILRMRSSSER